jgi:bacteriocin biosynthesis cyclodehydratase domain-containing protein
VTTAEQASHHEQTATEAAADQAVTEPPVRLVPGATLLDSGPDETHLLLPNHNVTFLTTEVTRIVHAFADLLSVPTSRSRAIRLAAERTRSSLELCDYVWGLLDKSGCLARGSVEPVTPLHAFWASQGLDPGEAQQRLAAMPVVLVTPAPFATAVSTALGASGLESVVIDTDDQTDQHLEAAISDGAGLLACFGVAYGSSLARSVNAIGLAHELPMLYGQVSGLVARIGPFVLPRATACLECTVLRMLAHAGAAEARVIDAMRRSSTGAPPAAPVHPTFLAASASLFVLEVANIGLSLPAQSLGAVIELVHGQAQSRRRPVNRVPTCPACHPGKPRRFGWDATFRSWVLSGDEE